MAEIGVIAAGHELSARAGAEALRAGGNAVDAALAAMLTAVCCESLLTGLGAGGYMLVVPVGSEPVLLDFFVEMPGRGLQPGAVAELVPVEISFGDAVQVFNIGPASVGTYGVPAGVAAASERFGRLPLAQLTAPAAALAREGVPLNGPQARIVEILSELVTSTPECAALFAPAGELLRAGDVLRQPGLADALEVLGSHGAGPFYTGAQAAAIADWLGPRGGLLTLDDLAAYRVIDREPVRVGFRGREVLTNPPPSAGGILIARALSLLAADAGPAPLSAVIEVMRRTQAARTTEFLAGLDEPGFAERFLHAQLGGGSAGAGRLGSTTHVAALDRDGLACSVTCSNGSSSGVVVPGTGIHLNNMLGEQDLNPLGFHRYPAGRRLPSMMAPTVVRRAGAAELVLGSAGSNRIRSAILQTILRVVDDGLDAGEAVRAPRVHFEDGVLFTEPGVQLDSLQVGAGAHAGFRELNLFFGGVQAVQRDSSGRFWGGGDPRRGGAAFVVSDPDGA
ncbi:MAG TPA: gamma-glutamyltransferase [Solirubrobacteraceae bacterium]